MTSTPQPSAKDGSVEARMIANKIACEATSTRSAAAVCRDGALAIDALVFARVEALAKERDDLADLIYAANGDALYGSDLSREQFKAAEARTRAAAKETGT